MFFVYKYLNGLLPLYTRESAVHMIDIRNCHDLYLPRHRLNISGNSIQIRRVKVWNAIPVGIRNKINSIVFALNTKVSLIQMYK